MRPSRRITRASATTNTATPERRASSSRSRSTDGRPPSTSSAENDRPDVSRTRVSFGAHRFEELDRDSARRGEPREVAEPGGPRGPEAEHDISLAGDHGAASSVVGDNGGLVGEAKSRGAGANQGELAGRAPHARQHRRRPRPAGRASPRPWCPLRARSASTAVRPARCSQRSASPHRGRCRMSRAPRPAHRTRGGRRALDRSRRTVRPRKATMGLSRRGPLYQLATRERSERGGTNECRRLGERERCLLGREVNRDGRQISGGEPTARLHRVRSDDVADRRARRGSGEDERADCGDRHEKPSDQGASRRSPAS